MTQEETHGEQQADSIADEAERIAADGESVREQVKRLVLGVAGGRGLRVSALRRAASEIVEGVTRGVREVGEDRRGTVLAETIEGLSDGFSRAAQATKLAIEEAEGRGARFTQEDLKTTAEDLRTLEKMFEETVGGFSSRLAGDVKGQAGDIAQHASRAVRSMRPSIESALEAATRDPAGLAGEAASAGVDTARSAVGSLFSAAAGMLDAAGEIVAGKKPDDKG